MGNHFRTSGAGDDAPKTQTGVQGSRFATPDSEGQPVAQAPDQPADQAQPASDPFAYNPTSDVALSGTAGFEPVQAVTASRGAASGWRRHAAAYHAGIPDPMAPATPVPQPAQSGLFAAIPDPTQPAAPVVESDQPPRSQASITRSTTPILRRCLRPSIRKPAARRWPSRPVSSPSSLWSMSPRSIRHSPTSLHSTTSTSRSIRRVRLPGRSFRLG